MTPERYKSLLQMQDSTWDFYARLCGVADAPLTREDRRLTLESRIECLERLAWIERQLLEAENLIDALAATELVH